MIETATEVAISKTQNSCHEGVLLPYSQNDTNGSTHSPLGNGQTYHVQILSSKYIIQFIPGENQGNPPHYLVQRKWHQRKVNTLYILLLPSPSLTLTAPFWEAVTTLVPPMEKAQQRTPSPPLCDSWEEVREGMLAREYSGWTAGEIRGDTALRRQLE